MIADALKLLTAQAGAAVDVDAANEVLARVAAIAHDESLPASRELALALLNAACTLVPLGAPGAVEDLFHAAQRWLSAASDARIDDQLLLWQNLAALYDRQGANEPRNQTLALIGRLAETCDGPLDEPGVQVFLEQGLMYRRLGKTVPMLTMLRQVHRQRCSDACNPSERLAWFVAYAEILLEAARPDEAAPVLSHGATLARELGDAEREASLLNRIARSALTRGDADSVSAAVLALERARGLCESTPALADSDFGTAVLHNLVGAWIKAADEARWPQALQLIEHVIERLRQRGQVDSDDFAHALFHRAELVEYLADWPGAARGYAAAAATPNADAQTVTECLSLAGRAWFEAGEFDAASDCYFAALRRRIAAGDAAAASASTA